MSSKQKRGSLVGKIILGIMVVLLVLILVAEFGLRWFMGHQMKSQFEQANAEQAISVTEEPEVSFGSTPLIFGMLQGKLSEMNMHTPSTLQLDGEEIKGQPETDIQIKDMTLSNEPVAGSLISTAHIPDSFLLATFQQGIQQQSGVDSLGSLIISDMKANGQDGTIDVQLGAGLANLVLEPSVQDGALALTAKSSQIFGFELPQEASQKISEALTEGLKDQFVGDLSLENVAVTNGEVAMTIVGHDVPMNDIGNQLGSAEGQRPATQNS